MAKDSFTDALRRTWQQARVRKPNPDELIQEFRRITEAITLEDAVNEVETRGPGFLVSAVNRISNGSFETNLTGWTEVISGVTANSQRTTEDAYTIEGSLGSVELEITVAAGAGYIRRYQDIAVSPGQVWSFGAWRRLIESNGFSVVSFYVQWLNGGGGLIDAIIGGDITTPGDWQYTDAYTVNATAPAGAATARVICELNSQAFAPATGKARFDLVRAELSATLSTRLTRIIVEEWTVEAAA